MCGRYSLFVDPETIEQRFDARFEEPHRTYNAAPGQRLPVITDERPAEIGRLEWGLVPGWAGDDHSGRINARAETIDEKPSFRDAYEAHGGECGRCLVLADGFYEWVEEDGGKRPYRVAFEDDRPFAMAGLWARREPETTQVGLEAFGDDTDPEPEPLETFTIVTTEPNDLVADLHHRMAVILEPEAERRWLAGDDLRDGLEPYPSAELRAYPVSRAVNSPGNDDPSLVEPLE